VVVTRSEFSDSGLAQRNHRQCQTPITSTSNSSHQLAIAATGTVSGVCVVIRVAEDYGGELIAQRSVEMTRWHENF